MGGAFCFGSEGDWKDEILKPGKYWVGLLPIEALHPDEEVKEEVVEVKVHPLFAKG
jgi:hypothetical protein